MATKSENSAVSIYTKYVDGDKSRVNEDYAMESETTEDTIVWNSKTWKEAIKPFLGKGAQSFASQHEAANSNNNNNSNSNNNNGNNEGEVKLGSDKKIDVFCGGDIPVDYANQAFKLADVIFVSRDKRSDGKLGSVRGFLCLNIGKTAYDGTDKTSVYIDLICNAKASRTAAGRQGKINASGKLLLMAVIGWAKTNGYKQIALKALETVIPYYYKFGWRFITSCSNDEKDWVKDDVKDLYGALKAHAARDSTMEDLKEDTDINASLRKFKKWLPNLTNETMLRTIVHQDDENWDSLPEEDQNTIALHAAHRRDDGYPMLLCLPGNEGEKKTGGRRKRRTKKKRNKRSKSRRKKHRKKRTTRSKKVRKKRRKNKTRRGGGGSSSNESMSSKRARERGVNIMPTIRNDRIWSMKTNGSMSPGNILQKYSKKHWVSPGRHH